MKISIAEDFSDVPIGRTRDDGDFSGQAFREDYLMPNLKNASAANPLIVNFNGAEGYPPSFLEEAFGGLVRHQYYSVAELEKCLKIEADNGKKAYVEIAWEYIHEADKFS